jgi:4-hydroxy-tetrahydrodipicolinate synthase
MKNINLKGSIPAAILPMTSDYQPVYPSFARYVEWLIGQDAVAISVNMDTGEGPQLNSDERRRAIETAVETARGRVAVIAGVTGATTDGAVEQAKLCQRAGADGVVVFPNAGFRNEPLDARIPFNYHKAIADETGLPIVLFQLAPIFGGVDYSREVLLKLLEIPQVVAMKEASFDAQYFAFTKETIDLSGRDITLLTGNDRFITESILLGARGALLGFGAIGCGLIAKMLSFAAKGDFQGVLEPRPRLHAFAMAIYSDPMLDYRARCKAALAQVGVINRSEIYVRPPLLTTSDEEYAQIGQALLHAGMLEKAG